MGRNNAPISGLGSQQSGIIGGIASAASAAFSIALVVLLANGIRKHVKATKARTGHLLTPAERGLLVLGIGGLVGWWEFSGRQWLPGAIAILAGAVVGLLAAAHRPYPSRPQAQFTAREAVSLLRRH